MSEGYRLAEIAKWVGGTVRGDANTLIGGVAGVAEAGASQITWLASDKYLSELRTSRAGAVLVAEDFGETPMPAILVPDPALAFSAVLERFAMPVPRPPVGVHPTALVAETAVLGAGTAVGPNVVIGEGAKIGERTVLHAGVFVGSETVVGRDCELWPGVVVRERCTLGNQVVIHPNTVVGADGFGYEYVDGRHAKIPQIGTVEIGDDVEIGANCCIDRAKFGATRIGAGTKIDNLVQIAHNVQIGPACVIVAQCGIAGSTRLGKGVVLGGKVGVRDHVALGDGVQAGACSCISKDWSAGTTLMGIPALDSRQFMRGQAKIRHLPEMAERLKELIKRVDRLEASADDSESS
jgi:UDP-3-O-[3-hydroxymyristoyl] glucosamine N-acyltransferase